MFIGNKDFEALSIINHIVLQFYNINKLIDSLWFNMTFYDTRDSFLLFIVFNVVNLT